MVIIIQDDKTGFWDKTRSGASLRTHPPDAGTLCDIHNRRGEEPWASWVLNWRTDRGIMEMIDPIQQVGHPTPAQVQYFRGAFGGEAWAHEVHGCNFACAGAYDQLEDSVSE